MVLNVLGCCAKDLCMSSLLTCAVVLDRSLVGARPTVLDLPSTGDLEVAKEVLARPCPVAIVAQVTGHPEAPPVPTAAAEL